MAWKVGAAHAVDAVVQGVKAGKRPPRARLATPARVLEESRVARVRAAGIEVDRTY